MAATAAVPSLTRARSLHRPSGRTHLPPPSPGNPPLQPTAGAWAPTATAASMSPFPYSTAPLPISTASNVSIFLANLRILDLDRLPDWPDITPQTFTHGSTTTTARALGQKRRVQCVEWALFHLFSLWDPDDTKSKLQSLFPPVDQVQSVALRGALLRLLEQTKKSGVLGRDVLIRKTILDECKGERLEEVLAVFSSTVLRKVVAEEGRARGHHLPLAQSLALEDRGYTGERTELAVLAIAHKVSLRNTLQEKAKAKERFGKFSRLLGAREQAIQKRHRELVERARVAMTDQSEQASRDAWDAVRRSWAGDEQWIEALRYGGSRAAQNGFLSTPFRRAWRHAEQGRLGELEKKGHRAGLLEQLEERVRLQRDRLEKWKEFRQFLGGQGPARPLPSSTASPLERKKGGRGIDLGFGAHESLRSSGATPRKASASVRSETSLEGEYAELVQRLRVDLMATREANLGPAKHYLGGSMTKPLGLRTTIDIDGKSSLRSDWSGAESDESESTIPPGARGGGETIAEVESEEKRALTPSQATVSARSVHQSQSYGAAAASSVTSSAAPISAAPLSPARMTPTRSAARTNSPTRSSPLSPTRSPAGHRSRRAATVSMPRPPVEDSPPPASPTQRLVDRIVASVHDASPSPEKRPAPRRQLSLTERTRLSMVRGGRTQFSPAATLEAEDCFIDEEDRDPMDWSEVPPTPCPPSSSRQLPQVVDGPAQCDDLIARTQRSMAGFEAAQSRARLERRQSQRKEKEARRAIGTGRATKESYFDLVAEEAAGVDKEGEADEEVGQLAESLMQATLEDYEAVFRSRPRLKTSPVGTPVPLMERGA